MKFLKLNSKIKSFQLRQGKVSSKQIGLILLTALFFIGLIFLASWLVNKQMRQAGQDNSIIKKENLVSLSSLLEKENKKLEMPAGFPKDIPIINPKNVLEAYIRDSKTKDITLIIESEKSAKENFDYYLNYGKKNGWAVDEARETESKLPGKLLLRKDNTIVSMAFESKNGNTSKITISSTTIIKNDSPKKDLRDFKLE